MSSVYDAPPKRKKKDTATSKDNEKEKKEKVCPQSSSVDEERN